MKRYLEDLDTDYSKYVRDLIYADRLKKYDPEHIKKLIAEKQSEIKQLQEFLSAPRVMMDQINALLGKHALGYKRNAEVRTEAQRHQFIKNMLLPDLKKYGCTQSIAEIDQILLNYPDDNNGGNDEK